MDAKKFRRDDGVADVTANALPPALVSYAAA
jgi:hypothetical protein